MKIDKKTIDLLLSMNDDQLWQTIRAVAVTSGFKGMTSLERPKDLSKLRALLASMNEADLSRAMELINTYKHPNT